MVVSGGNRFGAGGGIAPPPLVADPPSFYSISGAQLQPEHLYRRAQSMPETVMSSRSLQRRSDTT